MNIAPAQLFVGGDQKVVADAVQSALQNYLCPIQETSNKKNCLCRDCKQIKQRQHAAIVWINPEKDYTVEDIEIIFDKIRFSLEEDKHHFFILEKAHTLTTVTANRLLKIMEEPPRGYHFILITPNEKLIIQTILSRCLVVPVDTPSQVAATYSPLLMFFQDPRKLNDPIAFEIELKKNKLNDTQSEELLHELIAFYAQALCNAHKDGAALTDEKILLLSCIVDFLHKKIQKPPQSGSSDLFWKHLYLTIPR